MKKGKPGTKKPPGTKAPKGKPSASSSRPAARAPAPAPASAGTKVPAKKPAAPAPAKAAAPAAKRAPTPVAPPAPEKKLEAPPKFRREYRKWLDRLISLRQKLHAEGERLGEEGLKAVEQEVSVDHMADFGSDSYEQDTTLALIENKSEALKDVDAAIRRIEIRTYGLCEECEQLIPSGRLEVLPHARYCVGCQAKREGFAP